MWRRYTITFLLVCAKHTCSGYHGNKNKLQRTPIARLVSARDIARAGNTHHRAAFRCVHRVLSASVNVHANFCTIPVICAALRRPASTKCLLVLPHCTHWLCVAPKQSTFKGLELWPVRLHFSAVLHCAALRSPALLCSALRYSVLL